MSALYLLRFDDICPAMNWAVWDQVETSLREHHIKPIVAVVPDNRDPSLNVAPPVADFWDRVRAWQGSGWTIGMHGFQHRYVTAKAGIVGLNARSEFAGLPRDEQTQKIRAGLEIFRSRDVTPEVWIAPGHSFDEATVEVLTQLGLRRISDGFFRRPIVDTRGAVWVPQQLWRLKRRDRGLWTVCYHINRWTDADVAAFRRDVARFAPALTDFATVCDGYPPRRATALDWSTHRLYCLYLHAVRGASVIRGRLRRARPPA